MTQRTLVLIKPDAVASGNLGRILSRYEDAGFWFEAMELRTIGNDLADRHYVEHLQRDFYPEMRAFITSGPLLAAVLRGDDAVTRVRELHGATDPDAAFPGTVRADFAESIRRNAVHASDSPSAAEREIALWFPGLD